MGEEKLSFLQFTDNGVLIALQGSLQVLEELTGQQKSDSIILCGVCLVMF